MVRSKGHWRIDNLDKHQHAQLHAIRLSTPLNLRDTSALLIPNLGCIIPDMGIMTATTPASINSRLGDALFTKVQQRVLGILLGNPGRSFYGNEIIRLAGSGTGAVQRELTRLEAGGLVTISRIGNQKHFQANPAAPIFEELRALILKTSGLADVMRSALVPLATDIEAAFVCGPLAKGEDATRSDVDLVINRHLTTS